MRISAGSLRGRTFYPPADKWPTRPTTDISREALFNILTNRIDFEEIEALDLFGGTGAHTYEMISRGCTKITYVDLHRPAAKFTEQTLKAWDCIQFVDIKCMDFKMFINNCSVQFDYIFAGPPYPLPDLGSIPDYIFNAAILKETGLFVLEHNPQYKFNEHPHFIEERKYGQTRFSFFHYKS